MEREIAEMERKKEEALRNEIVEKHSPKKQASEKGKLPVRADSASESGLSNL